MAPESVFGLVVVFVLTIALGLLFSSNDTQSGPRNPIGLADLSVQCELSDAHEWEITITRRSGYVDSVWEFRGNKRGVVDFANAKLRQARIGAVAIRYNAPKRFEVVAFFESSGQRRTGKYVGGYIIVPKGV